MRATSRVLPLIGIGTLIIWLPYYLKIGTENTKTDGKDYKGRQTRLSMEEPRPCVRDMMLATGMSREEAEKEYKAMSWAKAQAR